MADETLTEIIGNEALTADLSEAQVLVMRGMKGEDGENGHSLRVNSAGHVEYYDDDTQQWVDTGIEVEGVPGPQGPAGTDGEDGYSPTVSIVAITGGHRITITDKDHPQGQSFDVMDGEDGDSSGARLLYYFPNSGVMQWYEHPGDESLQEITGEGVSDLVLVDGFAVFVYEPGLQRVYQLTQLPDDNGRLAIFISEGNPKLKLTMNWQNSGVTKTDITEQKPVRYYRHYTAASGIFLEHEIVYEDNGSLLAASGVDIADVIAAGIQVEILDYPLQNPNVYKPEAILAGTTVIFRSTSGNGTVSGLNVPWESSIAVPFTAIGDMPTPGSSDVGKVPTVNASGGYTLQTPSGGGGFELPEGGEAGQALISDGEGGAVWGQAQSGGSGLSGDVKQALLACFAKVAWIDSHGQDYYDALEAALYPPANLVSISAVFTQGSHVIYDTDSLETLKQYLVVTAHFSDSSTDQVSNYTLSGTLSTGTSRITVSYGGKSAMFNVNVTHREAVRKFTGTGNWTGTRFYFTALINNESINSSDEIEYDIAGRNWSKEPTVASMSISGYFGDNSGHVSNSSSASEGGTGTTVKSGSDGSYEFIRTITVGNVPSTPYLKVVMLLENLTAPFDFEIERIKVTVGGEEREILEFGGFATAETFTITEE